MEWAFVAIALVLGIVGALTETEVWHRRISTHVTLFTSLFLVIRTLIRDAVGGMLAQLDQTEWFFYAFVLLGWFVLCGIAYAIGVAIAFFIELAFLYPSLFRYQKSDDEQD